ncbi:MAG: hypothetical protein M1820_003724 [Bogoriella megaspora]|nr:MAG: hypothetical protein M1820_003724 [Bogoriella megaspora]
MAELHVNVERLSGGLTTRELYDALPNSGNIRSIRIDDGRRTARVVFCPPPADFGQPSYKQRDRAGKIFRRLRNALVIEQAPAGNTKTHRSPTTSAKYPERVLLRAESIKFGLFHKTNVMIDLHTIRSQPGAYVYLLLNLQRKELEILFTQDVAPVTDGKQIPQANKYKIIVRLSSISCIYEHVTGGLKIMTLPLEHPPKVFRQVTDQNLIRATHNQSLRWYDTPIWTRQTEIARDTVGLSGKEVSLKPQDTVIDLGRWTVYRFAFNKQQSATIVEDYNMLRNALNDYNITSLVSPQISITPAQNPPVPELLEPPAPNVNWRVTWSQDVLLLEDGLRYQLEVCLSQDVLSEFNITKEFIKRLTQIIPDEAKSVLESAARTKQRFFNPMDIFRLQPNSICDKKLPPQCFFSRSATVTPTRLRIHSPTLETTNRVIRKYNAYKDHFLRVRFTDEVNEGRLRSDRDNTNENLFRRVRRVFKNGIKIGDRHYKFLAYGNSQFREHGAYFFAPVKAHGSDVDQLNANMIREWMGDFKSITTVAKYASRLGQCFSTTRDVKTLMVSVRNISDVDRNGFCFTDGIGKISPFLARAAAQEFNLLVNTNDTPSAFQFRLGGFKGVLAVDPSMESENALAVAVRPSQDKFTAQHQRLEVIRTTTFAAATLNRQLIAVLSTLGVKDEAFSEKMDTMLQDLDRAMTDKRIAARSLVKNVDMNQTSLTLNAMIADGFMDAQEPFMLALLHLWRSWMTKYLKEKAKIFVEKGAFLLGVTDESGMLRGHYKAQQDALPEVFIQIPDVKNGGYEVIKGICVVGRNPSLHPGDLRVVNAVDNPALRHHRNVVVFPQTGDRDLPNMCAGGDLDGDDYIVIWDTDLIPPEFERNYPPMDYTGPQPVENRDGVKIHDITEFFIEFIKNDRLPFIALAHLAWYDRSDTGVKDSRCLQLARLHSQAVDFAKTGVPAQVPLDLFPNAYPHFMEKKYKKNYHSKKILGKLYDRVELSSFAPHYELSFDTRILQAYPVNGFVVQEAANLKKIYDREIRRVMAKHDIRTEFEVWSCFVLQHNRDENDYEFAQNLGKIVSALKEAFREEAYRLIEGYNGAPMNEDTLKSFNQIAPFVHAMYVATAGEVATAIADCDQISYVDGKEVPCHEKKPESMPLMSFPWLFQKELGWIANGSAPSPGWNKLGPEALLNAKKACESSQSGNSEEPRANTGPSMALSGFLAMWKAEDEAALALQNQPQPARVYRPTTTSEFSPSSSVSKGISTAPLPKPLYSAAHERIRAYGGVPHLCAPESLSPTPAKTHDTDRKVAPAMSLLDVEDVWTRQNPRDEDAEELYGMGDDVKPKEEKDEGSDGDSDEPKETLLDIE